MKNALRALATGLLSATCLLISATDALAFERLEITVLNPQIVEGRPAATVGVPFSVRVRAVNADGTTDTNADFINAQLSADVPASLPAAQYLLNGERQFDDVIIQAEGTPVRLRVRDLNDVSVPQAEIELNAYDAVTSFTVTVPTGEKRVGEAIDVTVQARDSEGDPVMNFRDDVLLDAAVGNFDSGPQITLQGSAFALGEASTQVVFLGTDPNTRENTLTVANTRTYPGQMSVATGSAVVTPLRPQDLATVVLLLPGEVLTPGVSPGKSGMPLAQVSGNAFDGVTVWATDQYWNPVEPGSYPTLSWSSDDPAAGVVLPPGGPMVSNVDLDESVRLFTAGTRRVTVTASGPISASSESNVLVNPEGLDHFVFDYAIWDTTRVQVTTIPFQIRVRAEDSSDNLFPFNGQVTVRAKIGEENPDWILIDDATFENGYLNTSVQVTRRAFSAQIVIDSNGGVVERSATFQVNAGPLDRVLFEMPGEEWERGRNDENFSGLNGEPLPVVAGQEIDVLVIPVDKYANLVPGQRNVTVGSPTGYFELPDHPNNTVTLNNPTSVRAVLRTAGPQNLAGTASGVDAHLSSTVNVSPAPYARMVVEAPGENLDPGIFDTIENDGKTGTPQVQDAGVPFDVTVYPTDSFWNPITDLDAALPISASFSSSDAAAALPVSPQSLNSNQAEFAVTLVTLADPNQQTVRIDDDDSGVFGLTTIPVKAGTIDHFDIGINSRTNPTPNDGLDPIPDHQAGSYLPNVTVVARDQFNNHIDAYTDSVTISVSLGDGLLQPVRVSMADGFGAGDYQGVWRGPIRITRAGQDVRLFAREDVFASTDSSNTFDVFPGTYEDLVVLLPGETHTPGITPGKVGTPLPVMAGDPVVARVIATDEWWNPVAASPTVHFESSDFFQMISANDQALDPAGDKDFDLLFRTASDQTLAVSDLITPTRNDASTVSVQPGPFERLMVIAPGEVPNPGGPESDGKTGSPAPQTASVEFDFRVRSVDRFWNLVDNSTDRISIASDDNSLSETNPVNNGQSLVNGEITFPVFLINPGYVNLNAVTLDNVDVQGQSVTVPVEQGATYRITTPPTAQVGPPQVFPTFEIALVDTNGVPLAAANNLVTMRALKSNLEPATAQLFVTQAQLENGSVSVPNQAYDTVEDIIIEISDASGRLAYSNVIRMQPNGLEYVVTMDAEQTPRVGPPATFPVSVRLQDVETKTRVEQDRPISVDVYDALGQPGAGVLGTTTQRLDRGTINFEQSYTRAENVYLTVTDSTGLGGSSPIFALRSDGYKRLQVVAPGEVVEPGVSLYEDTGKSGAPDAHRSGQPFPITVRAVDQYWNLADTTNVGDLRLVASDNSFALPNNPDVNNVPFVSGKRTFTGFLTDPGTVEVTIYDEADVTRPAQMVPVPVEPPYVYAIEADPTASTGAPFRVTVRLIDPVTGNVVPTAQTRFYLTALLPSGAVANGGLGVQAGQLVNGVQVIADQTYDTVEDFRIRVSDDFGREAVSDVIRMNTGGLYFRVTLPDTATVGPPTSFQADVELIDGNTGQVVVTQDRMVQMSILSASTGVEGTGELGVRQAQLEAGRVTVAQSYTRSEDVFLSVSDTTGVTGLSNVCVLQADGYKRLQIVAPGETAVPGSNTPTGKIGTVATQQAEAPFTVRVRAVDQYYNLVDELESGELHLTSSGSGLDLVDPGLDGAAFVNGSRDFEVVLGDPGVIPVFVTDATNSAVGTGRVDVPVNEAEYEIVVPDPAIVTAGPPATFPVTVRLVNPETGERINAGNEFSLQALRPDRSAASDRLGIETGTLTAGESVIAGQSYATSEQIVIRVSDVRGRESFSDPITVQPVGVTWSFDVPDTVVAGEPWTMSVSRIDIVTGQRVTMDDRSYTLRAFSGNQARPDTMLSPAGVLCDTLGTTVEGIDEIAGQCYDRAEPIYLELEDLQGDRAFSSVITVIPSAPQLMSLRAEEVPGRRLVRALRPDETVGLVTRVTDRAGNAIADAPVRFRVLEGDAWLGTAQAEAWDATTDAAGLARVDLTTRPFATDDVRLVAELSALSSNELLVEVIGPPRTDLVFDPPATAYGDGWLVSSDTRITLVPRTEDPQGIQAVFANVDVGDPPVPQQIYTGPFTLGELGAGDPGQHTLRFFAEEVSGAVEEVRTVELYTTTAMTTEKRITNRPNPFRAGEDPTILLFRPTSDGTATITIYDLYGGVVRTAQMAVQAESTAQFSWDGRNGEGRVVANGGYICRIQGDGYDLRRKIAVVK